MRKAMVDKGHPRLSVRRQSELLGINRNRLEPRPTGVIRPESESMAMEIDRLHLDYPELGARRISYWLELEGKPVDSRPAHEADGH
jgi:putative transposase